MVSPEHRESVSGDLLEEYRLTVLPQRGPRAANRWYLAQVYGYVWRATWMWAALFSASFVIRNAFDWFLPPASFRTRSMVTTWVAIGLIASASFSSAWRARSVRAALIASSAMIAIAVVFSDIGNGLMLAVWHDADTMWAIRHSGGMDEIWLLPIFAIVPATIVAVQAGIVARIAAAVFDYVRASSAASSRS